jgi:hypothetical protein
LLQVSSLCLQETTKTRTFLRKSSTSNDSDISSPDCSMECFMHSSWLAAKAVLLLLLLQLLLKALVHFFCHRQLS